MNALLGVHSGLNAKRRNAKSPVVYVEGFEYRVQSLDVDWVGQLDL